MCRHLAYVGPPATLSSLLTEPPHSLLHQSWAPRDMRGRGTINADGFGIGWYQESAPDAPLRYRRATPMWSDSELPRLAAGIAAPAVLAAVRSASVGMPVSELACAPFSFGGWLFSHNGVVAGWPMSVAKLAAVLPVTDLLTLDAPTDSALLWALVRHRLRAGEPPAHALAGVVTDVLAAAPESRLNLLITDGGRIYATTVGHALSLHHTPGRLIVASEPFDDDPAWLPLPDRRLIAADRSTYSVEEL
jgi:gamma-glutamyl hercynylcysteine S-oxide hydrolase